MTAQVLEVEAAGKWILWARSDSLGVEEKGIRMLDVEPAEHAVFEGLKVDVLAVARKVAMIGQSIEARAGTSSFIKQSA